jgi:hypothetical protein
VPGAFNKASGGMGGTGGTGDAAFVLESRELGLLAEALDGAALLAGRADLPKATSAPDRDADESVLVRPVACSGGGGSGGVVVVADLAEIDGAGSVEPFLTRARELMRVVRVRAVEMLLRGEVDWEGLARDVFAVPAPLLLLLVEGGESAFALDPSLAERKVRR